MSDHDQTIPRALVHKAGPEAVWLNGLEQVGEDRYRATGQVPRAHSYVEDAIPPRYTYYDVGLLTELGRQAGIASMHRFEGVPVESPTVFLKFGLQVDGAPVPNDRAPAPVPVVLDIQYLNRERPAEGPGLVVSAETTFAIDGTRRATARSLASAHDRGPYKAWRAQMKQGRPEAPISPVTPVDPARVGRTNPENVLVGDLRDEGDGFGCDVIVDQLHPHFFEHPMDHVPGVVHVEALRQAALLAAHRACGLDPVGAVVTRLRTRFAEFAELDLPITCHGTVGTPRGRSDGHLEVPVTLRLAQPGCDRITTAQLTLWGKAPQSP